MHEELVQAEQKHRIRYEKAKMTLIVVSTLTSVVTVGMLLGGMANLQDIATDTNQSAELLVDCTTPAGQCYQNGDRRSGAAVQTINRVSVLAAYCSKKPENVSVAQIEDCIKKELNNAK